MNVKKIDEVKEHLENLKKKGLIAEWELPYENLLTRLSAAIFFISPAGSQDENLLWEELAGYDEFSYRINEEKKLSGLRYRITFSKEEKEKNAKERPQDQLAQRV